MTGALHRTPTRRDARTNAWACFAAVAAGSLAARWSIGHDLGDLLGCTHLSPIAFGIAGALAAALLVVPHHIARPLALVSAIAIGFGATHARLAEPPPDHLGRLVAHQRPADDTPLIRVRGMVTGEPRTDDAEPGTLDENMRRFGTPPAAFTLSVDSLATPGGARPASGSLRVITTGLDPDGSQASVRVGDRIEALGLYRGPAAPSNPGQADGRLWAAQRGDAGSLRTAVGTITPLEHRGLGDHLLARAHRLAASARGRALTLLDRDEQPADGHTSQAGTDAVRAMLIGERAQGARTTSAYARTGAAHLLAISGFHLAVLTMLTTGIVRATGDRPRTEAVVGLAFLAVYLVVVPAQTPIVRAALLAASMMIARAFARRWDHLTVLGWVSTMLVIARPMDLTALGFQLTIGITGLLVWMSAERHPWTAGRTLRFQLDAALGKPRSRWSHALETVRTYAVTAVLAWLASAPLILYHTGSFNPLTPVAVIAATPVASLIQITGLAGLGVSVISEPIGSVLLGGTFWLGGVLAWVTRLFDAAGAHRVAPPVSVAWACAAIASVLWFIARARLSDWRPWAVLTAVAIWFGVEANASGSLDRGVAARVDMLAVGDGSCLLVRARDDQGSGSDGGSFLWDAGSLRPRMGVRTIPSSLRALGSPRVRTAIVTHANIDHYNALPDAARAIGLERVLISAPALASMRASREGSAERRFLAQMGALGVTVEPIARGDTRRIGDATLRVLWPPAEPPVSIRAANDRSLVARLEVPTDAGVRRVLLTGDIQRSAMLMLLADDEPDTPDGLLDAEITELAHHGSHHAVAETFLETIGPSAVLQSTGPSRLGDRRWNTTRRALDAWWGITARDGALWAEIRRDGGIETGAVRDD